MESSAWRPPASRSPWACKKSAAKALIQPWAKYVTEHTSFVTLKLAISLDGRIATRTGASKWITCPESRIKVQTLRAHHDAVMVGINTVLTDNPRLTVRDVPGRNPIRVIVDSKLRIPLSSQVVQTATRDPDLRGHDAGRAGARRSRRSPMPACASSAFPRPPKAAATRW